MKTALTALLAAAMFGPFLPARAAEGNGLPEEKSRKYQAAAKLRDETERPLLDRQRDGVVKVRELIEAGKSDREVQRELDGLKTVFAEIQAVESRYEAALANFLTPLERAKLAALSAAAPRKAAAGKAAGGDGAINVPGDEEEQE